MSTFAMPDRPNAAAMQPKPPQPRGSAAGRRRGLLAVLAAGVATVLCLALPAAAAEPAPCGGETAPCRVEGGEYLILRPEAAGVGVPAIVHLHGWGATAASAAVGPVPGPALARGYAVILPQGFQFDRQQPRDWSIRDRQPAARDDVAFLSAVLDDAAARHGIDRGRVLLSGFSRGGSMVWDIACRASGLAAAYAPVAGAFWEPLPIRCETPVRLFHTHGWTDRTVPLEGRSFESGAFAQGHVFSALEILRETNGCALRQPEAAPVEAGLWTRAWTNCAAGELILTLHPGTHEVPPGWTDRALDWFEGRAERKAAVAQ